MRLPTTRARPISPRTFSPAGERPGDQTGEVLVRAAEGELASFVIGVPQHDVGDKANAGAVYLISASDLAQLDSVDGRSDRAIGLGHVATGANSWKFVGERASGEAGFSVALSGDLDGDGETDLLVGAPYSLPARSGATYLISGADFAAADTADGTESPITWSICVMWRARRVRGRSPTTPSPLAVGPARPFGGRAAPMVRLAD